MRGCTLYKCREVLFSIAGNGNLLFYYYYKGQDYDCILFELVRNRRRQKDF